MEMSGFSLNHLLFFLYIPFSQFLFEKTVKNKTVNQNEITFCLQDFSWKRKKKYFISRLDVFKNMNLCQEFSFSNFQIL